MNKNVENLTRKEGFALVTTLALALVATAALLGFMLLCSNELHATRRALEQSLQAVSVFMIRFGVFYENDLEIAPGPNMTFAGPVHCNSDLYLNAGATSHFKDRVTSHGDIYRGRKDSSSVSGTVLIDDDTTCGVPMIENGVTYDSNHENWMTAALERWDGRVFSRVHGVPKLDPPIDEVDNPHDMIERPLDPTDPAYNDLTEGEKFSNKAGITIHAHADETVTAIDYFGNDISSRLITAVLVTNGVYNGKLIYKKNSDYTYEMAVDGCYDIGKTNFWDMRENCRMAPLDIYVDELLAAFPELYSDFLRSGAARRSHIVVPLSVSGIRRWRPEHGDADNTTSPRTVTGVMMKSTEPRPRRA